MIRIAVIGAGPAGLTAALELSKNKDFSVDLYESSSSVGGMAKTIKLWGHLVDLGPHRFFSKDPRVNKIWMQLAGNDYSMVNRITRIFYRDSFYDYPIKIRKALIKLGPFETFICSLSYLKAWLFPLKDDSNFENWMINRFGHRLYSIFFKMYSEKLWGIKCKDLDAEFASQRIRKISFLEVFLKSLYISKKQHRTFIDQFAYPNSGSGSIYQKMHQQFQANGGTSFLSTPVDRILIKNMRICGVQLKNGNEINYDFVISSMPLTNLVSKIPDIPAEVSVCNAKLRFRNTIIAYVLVKSRKRFPDQWIYINSGNIGAGRITNFSNWVPTIIGNTDTGVLALEYWCQDEDQVWLQDEKTFLENAKNDLVKTNLVKIEEIIDAKSIQIPKSYPIYEKGYRNNLSVIENYLRKIENLYPIGRYGSFKYNNQDHSILMGYLAAESIQNNKNIDLWEINSDDEYQETEVVESRTL